MEKLEPILNNVDFRRHEQTPRINLQRVLRKDLAPEFLQQVERLGASAPLDHSMLAIAILRDAQKARVSDIHFEPRTSGTRLRFRIDGILSEIAELPINVARIVVNQFKALSDLDPVTRFTVKDTRATVNFNGEGLDIRLAVAPCHHGEALVVRLLDPKRLERSLTELGLPGRALAQIEEWLEQMTGMFLCAGPTGSGKTTTCYALLHEVKFADRAIISIEDPIEYQVDGITQIRIDEFHHVGFQEAVKSVLRLDPDFLMLGEIRDATGAHSAVDAAISGRVLLSTLHCRDSAEAITALRNWGLTDHEIAETLSVVMAQRLVRKLCPHCQHSIKPTLSDLRWLKAMRLPKPSKMSDSTGCKKCQNLGYIGRTGLFELWRLDEDDYRLIHDHADEHTLRQNLISKSQDVLLLDAFAKIDDGTTSLAEVRKLSGLVPLAHRGRSNSSRLTPAS
jgi:type II secretory ATPase GspE/PulE/Tfp pilus assembly ATPase PilB-like protein